MRKICLVVLLFCSVSAFAHSDRDLPHVTFNHVVHPAYRVLAFGQRHVVSPIAHGARRVMRWVVGF